MKEIKYKIIFYNFFSHKKTNKYYQKHKERLQKEARKIKIFLKKEKTKGEKRFEKDIKIFLKKKSRNYLSI